MKIKRRKSKPIRIGSLYIGGNNPIAIQSMAKTLTRDIEKTLAEIKILEDSGCEIIRLAIKDSQDARAIKKIKRFCGSPLVADIHFDWRLAILAIECGIDKIRLNPGNIYKKNEIENVVKAARQAHIPIRVGVNSGSLKERRTQNAERRNIVKVMVDQALKYIKIIEKCGFYDIVISLKSSDVIETIEANRRISKICDYPLHLGVTAAGPALKGVIKSSVALGALLLQGIGDTIRISLTERSQQEVKVAQSILEALALRRFGLDIISCPTCGRCEVDLVKIVNGLEHSLARQCARPIKVAVMGCIVNGPGEARQADIGIAFGKNGGLLFKKGKPIRKIPSSRCVSELLKEINKIKNKS